MSAEWYRMTPPLFNGGFESDEFETYATDGFDEVLGSFIGEEVLVYESKLSDTPVSTKAIFQNVTGDNFNNSVLRQMLCRIGTLKYGSYVKRGDTYWVVSSLPDNNMMYEKAHVWLCKFLLRFKSPASGEVVAYPVYMTNATQYNSGESSKALMSIGNSQSLIYVPCNAETLQIDNGARFLIDKNESSPTAYRVTQVDTISYSGGDNHGLIQWTVAESVFDANTDNKELMVADYYGVSLYSEPDPAPTGGSLVLTVANDTVKIGDTCRVSVYFYVDGVLSTLGTISASITDGGDYALIETLGSNYVDVRILDNHENIGQEISVCVEDITHGFHSAVTLTIGGWY